MHADRDTLQQFFTAETFEAAAAAAGVDLSIDRLDARIAHLLEEAGPGWTITLNQSETITENVSLADAVKSNVRQMRLALQRLERWLKSR